MNLLIPMAGKGSRFKNEGYKVTKPLLPVYNRYLKVYEPMVVNAIRDFSRYFPVNTNHIIIDRVIPKYKSVQNSIKKNCDENQTF